jgi:hypothetical protein
MHFHVFEFFVIIVYSVWAVFSILSQSTNTLTERLKSRDLLNLLPNYKFFCPNPIRNDYHLYYRGRKDESVGEWKEIRIGRRIPLLCAIWNPYKRERKVFYKIVKTVRKHYINKNKRPYGHAYLLLLDFVQGREPDSFDSIQFRITSRQDLREKGKERDFFISNFHTHAPVALPS